MDYGDFPITKCPTKAAQGLTNKNAPSIKRIMKDLNAESSRERNLQRRAENQKILALIGLKQPVYDKLTAQRGTNGIESLHGYFQNQELFALKKILGKEVLFVQTETLDEDEVGTVKDAWPILQKRGKPLSVEGYEEYQYFHLELKSINVIGCCHKESDNIIMTWAKT